MICSTGVYLGASPHLTVSPPFPLNFLESRIHDAYELKRREYPPRQRSPETALPEVVDVQPVFAHYAYLEGDLPDRSAASSGRAAGQRPEEIRGHRDRQQILVRLAGRRETYEKDLI